MALLVPTRGDTLYKSISATAQVIDAFGPWAEGTHVERAEFTIWSVGDPATTSLRLGLSLSHTIVSDVNEFVQTQVVLRAYLGDEFEPFVSFLLPHAAQPVRFNVNIGITVDVGPMYVLMYTDLTDGAEAYDLVCSVRCRIPRRFKRLEPAES